MPDRDWNSELKKIDRALERASDEALLPARTAATPDARAERVRVQQQTSTLGVMARLVLAVILAVAMLAWPYDTRCGPGLFGYLGATGLVAVAGVWSAVWTWRHRSARGHVVALALAVWGAVLAATEVLPRVGYAAPTVVHPATWLCR